MSDIVNIFYEKTFQVVLDMLGKKVMLGDIDIYGMNGRKLHPLISDSNTVVQIISFDRVYYEDDRDNIITFDKLVDNKDYRIFKNSEDNVYVELIAKTKDGRFIEVLDYEIEKVCEEKDYHSGFRVLSAYFDSISEEQRPIVDQQLRELGL